MSLLGYKTVSAWEIALFSIFLIIAIYIATISYPGIYYDQFLYTNHPIISDLYYGNITLDEYLQSAKDYKRSIGIYDWGGGRFHPLYLVDLLFIVKYFGSIAWAWVYESVLFLIFMLSMYRVTDRLVLNKLIAGFAVLLLFLHPGFWYVWTTLASTTEAQTIAYLALSLFFYMRFADNGGFLNATLCICAVSIAFGFKEPTFIAVGIFAGTHALLNFRSNNYRLKILDGLLLGATLLFFLLYFSSTILPLLKDGLGEQGWYFQMKGRGEAAAYSFDAIFHHLKIYARTDPFLVYLLMPLAAVHFVQMAIGPRNSRDILVAAFFAGGVIWLLQYIAIGVSDAHFQYYAIPAYCFAIPALTAKFAEIFSLQRTLQDRSHWPYLKVVTAALVILAVWPDKQYKPGAIDWFLNNRHDNKFWAKTVEKAGELVKQNQPNKTYFYYYKSPRTNTIEAYKAFTLFMVDKGFLPDDFDLTYQSADDLAWKGHLTGAEYGTPVSPWSWARNYQSREMQSGDYMIVNSLWPLLTSEAISKVLEDFELVFGTNGLYDCDVLSFHSFWRYSRLSADIFLSNSLPVLADLLFSDAKMKFINSNHKRELCSPFFNRRNFYIFKKK